MAVNSWDSAKRYLVGASILAVLWCLAVAWKLYGMTAAGELDVARFAILLAHQGMGLVFLGCGWIVFRRMPNKAGLLFALYGVCTAVHWGGLFRADSALLKAALLAAFFLISSTLGVALLLHFTLLFPRPWAISFRKATLWALYGPMVPGTLASIAMVVLQATGGSAGVFESIFALFAFLLPNVFGLLAFIVVIARWARATTEERRRFGLTVMAAGNVIAIVPWLIAAAVESLAPGVPLPGGLGTDPYVLAFVLIPLSFLYAVLATARTARAGEGEWNLTNPGAVE